MSSVITAEGQSASRKLRPSPVREPSQLPAEEPRGALWGKWTQEVLSCPTLGWFVMKETVMHIVHALLTC